MMIVVLVLFFAINEIRPRYPVLDAVFMSYQDLGIITMYFFDWSETISQFFFVFRVALFDVDVVEPTCAFEWGFNEAYRMMLALPFCFAVVQAAAYVFGLKSGDEAYAGTLSFFVEAQASLLYYCISTFICRKIRPGNRSVYVEDPDTSCETASTTTMQIVAVFYLLLITRRNTIVVPTALDGGVGRRAAVATHPRPLRFLVSPAPHGSWILVGRTNDQAGRARSDPCVVERPGGPSDLRATRPNHVCRLSRAGAARDG